MNIKVEMKKPNGEIETYEMPSSQVSKGKETVRITIDPKRDCKEGMEALREAIENK